MDDLPEPSWSQQLGALGVPVIVCRRVLLVDDERENLDVLGALLEDDYEIELATNATEALAMVAKQPTFAAVISDQRMPGMTGMELLAELKRRTPATVRMMLTAYSDIEPLVAAVNEGSVHRFFLKPWNPEEMRSAVADAIWLFQAKAALDQVIRLLGTRKLALENTLNELRKAQSELLAAERLSTVGRFSAGIAHNIRNSLTVMMNLLELVQQNPAEQRILGAAQRAFQTLDGLLRLVNDVNSLARGQLGSASRMPVEIEPFLDRILDGFRGEPLGRDRAIRVTRDPTTRVLRFDPVRIRQAIFALLRTVAQAAPKDAAIELVVHPLVSGGSCFEVLSPPAGIVTAAIGEGGRQSNAPVPAFAEMELGLEICRAVADAHGGRVLVRPRPDRQETAVQLWITEADPDGE